MFDEVSEAIKYIESKRNRKTVDEFKKIVTSLDLNLHQKNMIHIVGTNGKGSTVNYIRAILNNHGYSVGTFTSPYLISHNDRIRINNKPIEDEQLLKYINKYYDVIEAYDLSMFEIDVIIMLDYFNSIDLDYRIIECGIGGSRDKTNIIEPVVSAITNIGFDHQELLGNSLVSIAEDKKGIIKPHQNFYTTEVSGVILDIFQRACDANNVLMHVIPEYPLDHYPLEFTFKGMHFTLNDQAIYQVSNARLAMYICDALIDLDEKKTIEAVEKANWPGRFELIKYKEMNVYLDGAHNIQGIQALIETIQLKGIEKVCVIFSALADKQASQMLDMLIHAGYPVYLTSFDDERSQSFEPYIKDKRVVVLKSIDEALHLVNMSYSNAVVTGSLHFISAVRKYLLS